MKALDLLVMLYSDYHLEDLDEDFEEAIEELKVLQSNYEAQEIIIADLKKQLEALQAPKTCDGCVHGVFGIGSSGIEVECKLLWQCSRASFDKYEPKDK